LEAPLTKPAISTKVIAALIVFADFEIIDILFNLSSETATIPTFGSIVQKGKFSACAFFDVVSALNNVDLPTFGKPTMPHLKLIIVD
jgi:hypothetical protein